MTRPPTRIAALAGAVVALVLLVALPAAAQSVDAAVDDLRGNDVTFEEGAITPAELNLTAEAAVSFAVPGAFFKVVVLASDVSDFPSAAAYADDVLRAIGGTGRVLVVSPNEMGIASNVDDPSELAGAEAAALQAYDATGQASAAVVAAGDVLGTAETTTGGASGGSGSSGSSSGSGSGILVFLLVAVVVVGVIVALLWLVSRNKKGKGGTPTSSTDLAAQKVRAEVDAAANLVIELNDAQELPGFTDEAKRWFRDGATMFADLQDDLEEADTREELEAVWPKLKECTWKLGGAKALAAGQPAPAQPPVEALVPQTTVFGTAPQMPGGPVVLGGPLPPPSAGLPPPPPQVSYQQPSQSPWLTNTAMVAMSVLAAQGIGNAMTTRSGRSRRPPSNDDWFGSVFGGGGGGSPRRSGGSSSSGMGRRSSGGGRTGRVGKGMGRRR